MVGTVHKCTVQNLTQFGAFAELEEGIDGLVHVSDLSWTKVIKHPKEVVEKEKALIYELEEKLQKIERYLTELSNDI
jgi:small subunit ribosomal protein S1